MSVSSLSQNNEKKNGADNKPPPVFMGGLISGMVIAVAALGWTTTTGIWQEAPKELGQQEIIRDQDQPALSSFACKHDCQPFLAVVDLTMSVQSCTSLKAKNRAIEDAEAGAKECGRFASIINFFGSVADGDRMTTGPITLSCVDLPKMPVVPGNCDVETIAKTGENYDECMKKISLYFKELGAYRAGLTRRESEAPTALSAFSTELRQKVEDRMRDLTSDTQFTKWTSIGDMLVAIRHVIDDARRKGHFPKDVRVRVLIISDFEQSPPMSDAEINEILRGIDLNDVDIELAVISKKPDKLADDVQKNKRMFELTGASVTAKSFVLDRPGICLVNE